MPTYDFTCQDCGHRFEIFKQIAVSSDTLSPKCDKCGGSNAVRSYWGGAPAGRINDEMTLFKSALNRNKEVKNRNASKLKDINYEKSIKKL